MKQLNRLIQAAAAASLLSMAVNAQADTQNLQVTATVQSVCKFVSTGSTLNFDINPSSTGPIAGTLSTPVTYKCSKGVTPTITAGNGSNYAGSTRQMAAGASLLPYSLTVTSAGAANGFGAAAQSLSVTGSVAQADYQDATASTGYTDTVLLTLTP